MLGTHLEGLHARREAYVRLLHSITQGHMASCATLTPAQVRARIAEIDGLIATAKRYHESTCRR